MDAAINFFEIPFNYDEHFLKTGYPYYVRGFHKHSLQAGISAFQHMDEKETFRQVQSIDSIPGDS